MAYTDEDIKKLKELLALGGYRPQLFNAYNDLYFKFLGKRFSGCKCHASNMFRELSAYAKTNKL